ncbi:MAG: hypothetical protein H6729_00170 [Deltaproteobacteria bacterium]|nr:hypothetical protein [Deltaproteobacteria bacterium]
MPGLAVTTSGLLCAVKARVRGRMVLIDVSKAARRMGVIPGMSETEARLRSEGLSVRPRSSACEVAFLERGAELLFAFGPDVEITAPDFLFVEISRSRDAITHRFNDADTKTEEAIAKMIHRRFSDFGHDVSVVVAQDPETARAFATFLSQRRWMSWSRNATGKGLKMAETETWVVASEETQHALFELPLDMLAFTDAAEDPEGRMRERLLTTIASLKMLGVHDVKRFHALPSAQVSTRFGAEGALLMRRARAESVRPLRRFEPKARLIERYDVDPPLESVEPMLFVLRRVFSNLEQRLEARALSSGALEIRFTVVPEDDSVRSSARRVETLRISFARPTRRAKTMLSLTKERLGGSLSGAVIHVEVEMIASAPDHGAQLDLFTAHEARVEALSELMGRLQAMLKDDEVFAPKISCTHRPELAWARDVFDVEDAIRSAFDEASSDQSKKASAMTHVSSLSSSSSSSSSSLSSSSLLTSSWMSSTFVLPKIHDALSVSADVANDGQRSSPWGEEDQDQDHWPKPVRDHQVEAFVVALPPRPLELLVRPEPIVWAHERGQQREGAGTGERERFFWRGASIEVVGFGARECFETEWWTDVPLMREYVVAEALDGRRFWIFWAPDGKAFVQGVFD